MAETAAKNKPAGTPAARKKLGELEYFSDAVGTIYADTIGGATLAAEKMLEDAGYGPVQAAQVASNLRFVGVARHGTDA